MIIKNKDTLLSFVTESPDEVRADKLDSDKLYRVYADTKPHTPDLWRIGYHFWQDIWAEDEKDALSFYLLTCGYKLDAMLRHYILRVVESSEDLPRYGSELEDTLITVKVENE